MLHAAVLKHQLRLDYILIVSYYFSCETLVNTADISAAAKRRTKSVPLERLCVWTLSTGANIMNRFPVRGMITVDEYRVQCRSSDWWTIFQAVFSEHNTLVFPPGGVQFIFVGLLIVVVGGGVVSFLNVSLLASSSPPIRASFLFASALVTPVIHGGFMMSVSLGFIYAQQNLVYYLTTLFSLVLGVSVYGAYKIYSGDVQLIASALLIASLVSALTILLLSRSSGFTRYAEFSRVKRIYMQENRKPVKTV